MSTKKEPKVNKKNFNALSTANHRNKIGKVNMNSKSAKINTPINNSNGCQRKQTAKTSNNTPIILKTSPAKTNRNQIGANWNHLADSIKPQKAISPAKKIGYLSKSSVIALDCEMVGVGPNGRDHMLARVSIVNDKGEVILDRYVKPTEPIIDFRTRYSGITPAHLENAHNFADVQAEVGRIKFNRILVGHALHNDLRVLKLDHPKRLIRDTSTYRKCREFSEGRNPSLRLLANCVLKYDIQTGSHCSVEDARATMAVYKRFARNWERAMEKFI